ncbi:DUF4372 domain-containing protein [Verrucomicrobiota bacterium sgz303538]
MTGHCAGDEKANKSPPGGPGCRYAIAVCLASFLGVIDRAVFGQLVRKTGAEKGAKGFSCWDQLVGVLFC